MPTLRHARSRFFAREGLPADGGYDDPWFDAVFGPVHYRIPNFALRADALVRHDLHHALTGYPTDWRGEVEINAWELGAGLGTQAWGWVIMLMGFFLGVVLSPSATLAAFARGRRSTNLYAGALPAGLLDEDLDAVRARLGVTGPVVPSGADRLAFAGATVLSALTALLLAAPLLALVALGTARQLAAAAQARAGALSWGTGCCCRVAAAA